MATAYFPAEGETTTNPHDKTKPTNLELIFALKETPKKGCLSIVSTDLYRGVIIPIFGNQSIGRIVRAGRCVRGGHIGIMNRLWVSVHKP